LTDLVDRFNLWRRESSGLSDRDRDRHAVRFFLVEGTDRIANWSVTAKCFAGDDTRPAVVFLRNMPTSSEFALFEFTHELGHASLEANQTEALRFVEPILIFVSAMVFLCAAGFDAIWLGLACVYAYLRLMYWWSVRREVEPEIIADAIGLKSTPSTCDADTSVAPLKVHLENLLASPGPSRREKSGLRKRLGMLRVNLLIHAEDRVQIITRATNYDLRVLGLNIVFLSAPIWGRSDPALISIILLPVLIAATLLVFLLIIWQDRLQVEFDKRLRLRG
jgi:hypothetical protein